MTRPAAATLFNLTPGQVDRVLMVGCATLIALAILEVAMSLYHLSHHPVIMVVAQPEKGQPDLKVAK